MSDNKRVYNFSAGPAVLPVSVLKKAQEELLCLPGAGASVMEVSHRSKTFEPIIEGAENNIRELLNVPNNYSVLFLQGGALLQFAMIPMNLLQGKKADYVVTGSWSKKALSEAKLVGNAASIWDGKETSFKRKPSASELKWNSDAAYAYICSNETIEGVQWQQYPDTGNVPLIVDSSSDIFSKPIDITKFGLIYACAQKNCGPAGVTIVIIRDDLVERSADSIPSLLNYKKISEAKSMLNTPPCFFVKQFTRKTKNIQVVMSSAQFGSEYIGYCCCADIGKFICGNAHSDTGTANQDAAIEFAGTNPRSNLSCNIRVVRRFNIRQRRSEFFNSESLLFQHICNFGADCHPVMVAADTDTKSSTERAGLCLHSAPANKVLNYKIKLGRKTPSIIT
ncbi:hypothetical protein FACS18942_02330 [Planctomycetales bacterium]|nr:hypothetical protein FACS18942_02330 [Planctomycetales bacterium]